jgi:hypothetical protein
LTSPGGLTVNSSEGLSIPRSRNAASNDPIAIPNSVSGILIVCPPSGDFPPLAVE